MRFSKLNKFILVAVSVLLLLSAGGLNAQAEEMDSMEIRGPVYTGTDLDEILANEGGQLEMNALNFPFYYDIDANISTEQLSILSGYNTGGRTIGEGDLVYTTSVSFADFAFQEVAWTDDFGNPISSYPVLSLFGEPYVPLDSSRADKLAKLLLDDDNRYTLRAREILDLGSGYALEVRTVDVENEFVWLVFSKDGEYVDDATISVSGDNDSSFVWQVYADGVEGEDDVVVLRVHVNQVFQGMSDSIAVIEGLWLIDYEDAITLNTYDEIGELELEINGPSLEFSNPDPITLYMDSEQEIAGGLIFVIADDPELRFYLMKECYESGTYEIRGAVAENSTDFAWDFSNFPAFYYEVDDNIATESLTISNASSVGDELVIPADGLVYSSSVMFMDFENYEFYEEFGGYEILALSGELFVPFVPVRPDKLAELLIDDGDSYRIEFNETLDLGLGYGLKFSGLDDSGEVAELEFLLNGNVVESGLVDTASPSQTWSVNMDGLEGENGVPVFRVHVNQVFESGESSFIEIDGLWLIDYTDSFTIEPGEMFGAFEANVYGQTLEFSNPESITLSRSSVESLGNGLCFRVADTAPGEPVRFYPFVEAFLEGRPEKLLIEAFYPEEEELESGENETMEFGVSTAGVCDVTWTVDGSVVKTDLSVNSSVYEALLPCGVHDITVEAKNDTLVEEIWWEWVVGEEGMKEGGFMVIGPVYNGTNFEDIFANLADNGQGYIEIDARNFAGFYYDIDDNVYTETLSIENAAGRMIFENGLSYETTTVSVDYEYGEAPGWGDAQYPMLALFGEVFVPLKWDRADKLSRLLLDEDETHSLYLNEPFDLGAGYALEFRQIDETGKKVLLEFTKEGALIDDGMLDLSAVDGASGTWEVELDGVEAEDDVVVLRVHVNQAFKDGDDSFIELEGLWLIDYANAFTIDMETDFGALEAECFGPTLVFTNYDDLYLDPDSGIELGKGFSLEVAESGNLRFCLAKEFYGPGTYEIRGEFVEEPSSFEWDCYNFPAFFYEMDGDVSTENLEIRAISGRTIDEGNLVYTTGIEYMDYEFDAWNYYYNGMEWEYTGGYPMEVLFGETFVPLDPYSADKLAPLVRDEDEEYRIRVGETLDLGAGYGLKLNQVDVDGNKVWLEFTGNGEVVDNEVVALSAGHTWNVELDNIEGENDVLVLKVNIDDIFKDGDDSFVLIGGVWLIDYEQAFTVQVDDVFGVFEACAISDSLEFSNDRALTLYADSTLELARGIQFRVADSNVLRFYPFMEIAIDGEENGSSSGGSGGGASGGNWISWDDPESDGGTRITTAELQQIIYYWLNDLPVHPEV